MKCNEDVIWEVCGGGVDEVVLDPAYMSEQNPSYQGSPLVWRDSKVRSYWNKEIVLLQLKYGRQPPIFSVSDLNIWLYNNISQNWKLATFNQKKKILNCLIQREMVKN